MRRNTEQPLANLNSALSEPWPFSAGGCSALWRKALPSNRDMFGNAKLHTTVSLTERRTETELLLFQDRFRHETGVFHTERELI